MATKVLKTLKFGDSEDTYVLSPDWKDVHNKPDYDKIIDIERKRINAFLALPEGSTTGDAVLADMCVGHDGKVYNSAGEALRGQIEDVYFSLQGRYELDVGLKFEDYQPSKSGEYVQNNIKIPVSKGMVIRSDYAIIAYVYAYDADGNKLSDYDYNYNSNYRSNFEINWDGYVDVKLRTDKSLDEVISGVRIYMPMTEDEGLEYLASLVHEVEDKVNDIHNDATGMYDKEVVKFADYNITNLVLRFNETKTNYVKANTDGYTGNETLIPVSKGMVVDPGKHLIIEGHAAFDLDGNFLVNNSIMPLYNNTFTSNLKSKIEVDWDGYIQFSLIQFSRISTTPTISIDEAINGVKIYKPSNINDDLNDLLQRVAALEG